MEELNPLVEALKVISVGGGNFLVGMLVSVLAEKSERFNSWSSADKSRFQWFVNMLLGLIATGLLLYAPDQWFTILAPFYVAIVLASAPYVGSQIMHGIRRKDVDTQVVINDSGSVVGNINATRAAARVAEEISRVK